MTADLADAPNGSIPGCEQVRTSPAGEPMPAAIDPHALAVRGGVRTTISCPRARPACRGTVTVRRIGRPGGKTAFRVPAGGTRFITVPLRGGAASGLRAVLTEQGRRGVRRSTAVLRSGGSRG